jgi:hypothetical protein
MYQAVTMQMNMPVGRGQFQKQQGLYMWGFMDWAQSPDALAKLFDKSMPSNVKGFEMVQKQQFRRKLTPNGWTGTGTFSPEMKPQ